MKKHTILGIHINQRARNAGDVQKRLTRHGCVIRTRIGLHQTDEQTCSPNGLILLDLAPDTAAIRALVEDLQGLDGVTVKKMIFTD